MTQMLAWTLVLTSLQWTGSDALNGAAFLPFAVADNPLLPFAIAYNSTILFPFATADNTTR